MLARLLTSEPERRSLSFQDLFGRGLGLDGSATASGKLVSDDSALQLSAVYGSIRIITDGVATLPIEVTFGKGAFSRPVAQPPSWVEDPSPTLRKIDILAQVLMSLLLRGNAYIYTPRDDLNRVILLDVIDPDRVEVEVKNGRLFYKVANMGTFVSGDILHIRGLVKPGKVEGLSPIEYARETIGLGLAAQEYGASWFGNGAVPAAIIEVDGEMTPEGVKLLKSSWDAVHKGSSKGGKMAVLTEGAKFTPLSVSPNEAQFLESRSFQVADIARIFGVPPHLLGDASGSTSWGSGLAEQSQNYVTHSLRPWVERIEEALTWLARSERPTVNPRDRMNVTLRLDHLLRGDYSSRISTYGSALDRGIYNLDEVRAFEGLPPLPNGEGQDHRVPLNTAPSQSQEDTPPSETPPPPADTNTSEEDDQ